MISNADGWSLSLSQNQIDKKFLVELDAPIYRSIVDINTYSLDQHLGEYQRNEKYPVGLLFRNLSEAIKKESQDYDVRLNRYTLFGDYGAMVNVEKVDKNIRRVRTFSYLLGDSEKFVEYFALLERPNIAHIRRRSEATSERNKKHEIYPLVLKKYLEDPQNLVTLSSEVKKHVHLAINIYLKASDVFFQEDKKPYFLMCVLFASLSVENRMWLVYERLTRGNPQKKTLGYMIEKSFKVDMRRRNRLLTRQFKSALLEFNNVRIKTVHPSTLPLRFPDDAFNALVCLGELLVRCNDYGI